MTDIIIILLLLLFCLHENGCPSSKTHVELRSGLTDREIHCILCIVSLLITHTPEGRGSRVTEHDISKGLRLFTSASLILLCGSRIITVKIQRRIYK